MLERTSEKLIDAISELEQLRIKDRNLFLETKAQGLVLLKLITKLSKASSGEVTAEYIEKAKYSVDEYRQAIGYLKLTSDIDREKEAENATGNS